MTTNIWWIRRDLRLQDNPALSAALDGAQQLIPLFILEPEMLPKAAPKRRAFLLNALADLDAQLSALGSRLILRNGPAADALPALVTELGGAHVFAQEDFSPLARERDKAIARQLDLTLTPGEVLQHPTAILKSDGTPYVVFTPYKRKWLEHPLPTPVDCLPAPKSLPPLPPNMTSEPLPPAEPVPGFPVTSAAARQRLDSFLTNGLLLYQSQRDRMDLDGTSRLSPYLRFGLISARECFAGAQLALLQAGSDPARQEIQTWISELIWREFYTSILYHFPKVMRGAFREPYNDIHWRQAPADLWAWQQGQTGYPVVDAALRQLLATGWMHNRGRMIVAAFLTKDLLINWQEGETWFMAQLVDGDPAANNGGWQWSAGTGTDAAPYFRVFNPVLQGKKFDPYAEYIAQWVPELAMLPPKFRHEPWKLSPAQCREYGFQPGQTYPERIVDHAFARDRALAAYKEALK
ncbi:MAG: deoxyribodipyrimidine photo-lyase [Anaerolineaceae bacterium]|nr:deoxyribodipyrimidine photo-lyase [Anaerolineaceae bacterium]